MSHKECLAHVLKNELIHRKGPWRNVEHVEWETLAKPYLVIFDYLTEHPEQSASKIGRALGMDKSEVNSVLYRSPCVFISNGSTRPLWSARSISRRVVTRLIDEK